MSEHRVPMLGASWRRYEDPAHSRDPRVRAVVGALATLPSPEPRAEFRTELRAQLVAIAPRIIAESAATETAPLPEIVPGREKAAAPARSTPRHADGVFARLRGISIGRPLGVAASVLTAFVLLFGGAVWMSQKALPGDTLYGLKRASESFRLSIAGSPTEKAKDYLEFAQTRVDEAKQLASRASADALGSGAQAGSVDSHTATLITSTLGSADSDVKNASSLLAQQAVSSNSSAPLGVLTEWAPSQLARLHALAAAMPDKSLRHRAQSSAQVVRQAAHRAKALAPAVASGCASTAATDDFGPLPLSGCSTAAPGRKGKSGHSQVKPKQSTVGTKGTNGSVQPPTQPKSSTAPAPAQSSSSSSPAPIIQLPTLPALTDTSGPISTCGVHLTVGPLPINLGSCASP